MIPDALFQGTGCSHHDSERYVAHRIAAGVGGEVFFFFTLHLMQVARLVSIATSRNVLISLLSDSVVYIMYQIILHN